MKYEGPLYGKIGKKYIKLKLSSVEVNEMEAVHSRCWEWLHMSNSELRLRMGELTAQEIRTCRAMLRSIIGSRAYLKNNTAANQRLTP
jgi:hypothetical protein